MKLLTEQQQRELWDYIVSLGTEPVGEIEASEHFYEHETFRHFRVVYIRNQRTKTWAYTLRFGAAHVTMTGYISKQAARMGAYSEMLMRSKYNYEYPSGDRREEGVDNDKLAAANIALNGSGRIKPGNVAYKEFLEAQLITEQGMAIDKELLINGLTVEINNRVSAGAFV